MDMFELRASVLKALAHPARLRIFDLLHLDGEKCVCDIAEQLQISQPMTSKHVAILRQAGLLSSRKDGALVFYRVSTPCIYELFHCLDRSISQVMQDRRDILERVKKDSIRRSAD